MERVDSLHVRYDALCKSVEALKESLDEFHEVPDRFSRRYRVTRSGAIHNFETLVDTFWKFLKMYLENECQVVVEMPSPRKIFLKAGEMNIIDMKHLPTLLRMVDDLNYTSHTYQEVVAQEISSRLEGYYEMLYEIIHKDIKL